jgi:1-acyl-sn-glycerol-3-phosphate acyltransferase
MGTHLHLEVCVQGPVPDEPCVIVSNHMSYLDPLAIGQVLPLSAIAKSEIAKWPALGGALEELGIVFVERGNARSGAVTLRKAMRLLRAGVAVLVFPEGTTTFGDDVLPFSRGAFGVARLMRVPVVPATLRYESSEACWVGSASLLPHVMKLHRQNEVRAALTFGPRLDPMTFPNAASLAAATRQHIRRLVLS